MALSGARPVLALAALCVLAGSALTLAQQKENSSLPTSGGVQCSVYRPQRCWYEVMDPTEAVTIPVCMEKHTCAFNMTERLACPFLESGTFQTVRSKEPCASPFLEESTRVPPTCATTCCEADAEEEGRWVPHHQYAGHKVFQPLDCTYHQYTRSEVLDYFQGGGVDIVVVGDSFMRQLFVRLVHLLRGQEHVADYRIHTHASYASCETADFFRVSEAYTSRLVADKNAQYAAMDSFFQLPAHARWDACPRKPMQLHYMFGSTFGQQARNIRRYAAAGSPAARLQDIVVSVMFWTHAPAPPQDWFSALEELQGAPSTRTLYLLGIPTARVSKPKYAVNYRSRNRVMREWAANRTAAGVPTHFLDFDAWSQAPNVPSACAKKNKHYACHLRGLSPSAVDPGANYFVDPNHKVPIGDFWSSEDGHCWDDMNAHVWQAYFNVAMKQSGSPTAQRRRRRRSTVSRDDSPGDATDSRVQSSRELEDSDADGDSDQTRKLR